MDEITNAHAGHRARLRQRVLDNGLEGLEPHEIIEFLLTYAIPRQDVNALAHALIRRFGSVYGVLNANADELMQVEGVGRAASRWLTLVGEAVAAREALRLEDQLRLKNYKDVFRWATEAQRSFRSPCCAQLQLDAGERLIFCRELCPSLSWGEPETLRGALDDVLRMETRSVIIVLFVGMRRAEPLDYDISRAQSYACALHAAGSELLDVVFVGEDGLCSMRRLNLVPDYAADEAMRMVREDYAADLPEPSNPAN